MKQPAEGHLRRRRAEFPGDLRQNTAGARQGRSRFHWISPERTVRDKGNPVPCAIINYRTAPGFRDAVPVLDGGYWRDGGGLLQLFGGDVAETDRANFSLCLKRGQTAKGLGIRHGGINPVQLIQIDAIDLEIPETLLAVASHSLGTPVQMPLGSRFLHDAALGGKQEPFRIGMQGVGNQAFIPARPIRPGRINKIDAELESSPQETLSLFP